jgi:hypothetical protein
MPKTVKVSLKKIVREIEDATKKLSAASKKAVDLQERKALSVKIKKLDAAKKQVTRGCGKTGYTLVVPVK